MFRQIRSYLASLVVFGLSMMTVAVGTVVVKRNVEDIERRQFLLETAELKDALQDTMGMYEMALRASVGLFRSAGDIDTERWHTFIQSMQLEQRFPGFQGVGFALAIPAEPGAIEAVEAKQRANGDHRFTLHPKGDRDFYTAITLLEPQTGRNRRAIGFDMYSEPTRRAAMERARDGDVAALSGLVTLVQENGAQVQSGTLMYLPVYTPGPMPHTTAERRRRLVGFTYGAFRMHDLVSTVVRTHTPQIKGIYDMALYDGSEPGSGAMLYAEPDNSDVGSKRLSVNYPLVIAGRAWTLAIGGTQTIRPVSDKDKPMLVLFAGSAIAVLISAVTLFLAHARNQLLASRQALSAEMAERRKAQEAVEMANSELIHRVKNTLAVVSAIATQTVRYSASLSDFSRSFQERLISLGRVQEMLRPSGGTDLDLAMLLRQLLEPYVSEHPQKLAMAGPEVRVPKNDIMLFSLTFNELATNATKYGAWSQDDGLVNISWEAVEENDESSFILRWTEHGVTNLSGGPHKTGFGSAVLDFAIRRAMGGTVDVAYERDGIAYRFVLPRASHWTRAEPLPSTEPSAQS